MQAEGLRDIIDFVGWFVVEGTAGNFECPEDQQCQSDKTMLCVRKIVGDTDYKWWDFQHCMMSNQMKEPGNAQPCAKKLGLDWGAISKCVSGSDGTAMLTESANVMAAAKPSVQYAPDIRIEGKQFKGQNFLKKICGLYTGTPPAGCSAENMQRIDDDLSLAAARTACIVPEDDDLTTVQFVGHEEVKEVFVAPLGAASHYEDPNAGACQSGEEAVRIQNVQGSFCSPKCAFLTHKCPTDVPAGVTAKPTCALQSGLSKYCALICSPSTDERSLRAGDAQCGTNASCKAISGTGICTYDK